LKTENWFAERNTKKLKGKERKKGKGKGKGKGEENKRW
jgi:hypothetical protein